MYAFTTNEILKIINFESLVSKIVVTFNILTDKGVDSISIKSIAFYPSSIPTTGSYIYFGENGNVVHLDGK